MNAGPDENAVRRKEIALLLLGPAFFVLAAWIFFLSPGPGVPSSPGAIVSAADIDPSPRRTPMEDPPFARIAVFDHQCSTCHKLFESRDYTGTLNQHVEVVLNHGINDNCFNCHDRKDRDRLVLRDGRTVAYADTPVLCSQCHGPVFRDWRRGAHGKTLGYWSREHGEPHRLSCSECHDPHAPAYEPIAPLPGPRTLRMGDPGAGVHHEDGSARNPLRIWSTPEETPETTDADHEGEHE